MYGISEYIFFYNTIEHHYSFFDHFKIVDLKVTSCFIGSNNLSHYFRLRTAWTATCPSAAPTRAAATSTAATRSTTKSSRTSRASQTTDARYYNAYSTVHLIHVTSKEVGPYIVHVSLQVTLLWHLP